MTPSRWLAVGLGIVGMLIILRPGLSVIRPAAITRWVTPSPALWPWALVIGIAGLTSNYCLTRAMALADAAVVGPMDFLRLPLIAVVGLVFYGEPFDWLGLGGAAVMFCGILASILAERARSLRH